MDLILPRPKRWLLMLTLPLLFLTSCHVVLVGAYDPNVDQGIQKISTDVSTLIVTIEKNVDDNHPALNNYENFRETYVTIYGEVENLKIRTTALPKYSKITDMVTLLDKNIHDLEELHKGGGFTNKDLIEKAKTLIELSLQAMLTAQNALKRETA